MIAELIWRYLKVSKGDITIHVVAVHVDTRKRALFNTIEQLIDNGGRHMESAQVYFLLRFLGTVMRTACSVFVKQLV